MESNINNIKKAIIVTHPSNQFGGCLYGLDYNKLCLLAEFRAKIRGSIKARFKTIEYKDINDLLKLNYPKYKITEEMYQHEISSYFELNPIV
jgi:hypothetical protein